MNIIPSCITRHDMKVIRDDYTAVVKAAPHACFNTAGLLENVYFTHH